MAVVVTDTNAPRYRVAPMGTALPKAGGPFKQNSSIFGDPRPREAAPTREAAPVREMIPVRFDPPKIRVMASAVPGPEPVPEPPADPGPANDGFLGQADAEASSSQRVSVAGTIILIAVGVGIVILLSD